MDSDDVFDDLLRRCRAGDEDATQEVVQRYSARLLGVARKLVGNKLQRRVDDEDIVQSALVTFFRRIEDGEFVIRDHEDIWRLLVTITVRKAQKQGRHNSAEQRDVAREANGAWLAAAFSRAPGPVEAIVFSEIIEDLARALENEKYGLVLEMILSGKTKADIAAELGISKRTVDRVLARVRERLENWSR